MISKDEDAGQMEHSLVVEFFLPTNQYPAKPVQLGVGAFHDQESSLGRRFARNHLPHVRRRSVRRNCSTAVLRLTLPLLRLAELGPFSPWAG